MSLKQNVLASTGDRQGNHPNGGKRFMQDHAGQSQSSEKECWTTAGHPCWSLPLYLWHPSAVGVSTGPCGTWEGNSTGV